MTIETDKLVIDIEVNAKKAQKDMQELVGSIAESTEKIKDSILKSIDDKAIKDKQAKIEKAQKAEERKREQAVKESAKRTEAIITGSAKNISEILSGGLGGVATVLGVKFALDFVKGITSKGISTQFQSKAIGTSTTELQLLQQVFKRIGSTAEDATSSIANLYAKISTGALDPATAQIFQMLGINPLDKSGKYKDTSTLIESIIRKTGTLPENQRRLVSNWSGSAGIAALTSNPELFNKYLQEAKRQGVISKGEIDREAELDRKFQDLDQRWKKIQATLLDKALPFFEDMTSGLEKLLHINKSVKIEKIPNNNLLQHGWESIKKALGIQENAFNTEDKKYFGDNPKRGYGKYQVTKRAFLDIKGHNPSQAELKNPALLEEVAKGYWEQAMRLSGGDVLGARAYYNGGGAGLAHYKKYGTGLNPADQQRWIENLNKYGTSPAQVIPQQNTSTVHNHNVSLNMGNVNLPGVSDPNQFVRSMGKMATTAYGFSNTRIA